MAEKPGGGLRGAAEKRGRPARTPVLPQPRTPLPSWGRVSTGLSGEKQKSWGARPANFTLTRAARTQKAR